MSAALEIKNGLVEIAGRIQGVTAVAGPTFGDAPAGDAIIITLLGSQPSDPGSEMQTSHVQGIYSADRAQIWLSSFTVEFWTAGNGELNLRRQTEFANLVRAEKTIGGLQAAALPDMIQGETNSDGGTDEDGLGWTILEADVRICHMATNAGGIAE